MKRGIIAGILAAGTGLLLLWHLKSERPYEPIVEDPHPQVDSLFNLMDQALRSRQYHAGANLARQALEISKKDKYRYGEVNSLMALGFVLTHEAKYDSAIVILERARKLVTKYRLDPKHRHRAGSFLAENYQAVGKIDQAFECFNEGVEYFLEKDDPLQLCATYNNLGLLYQSQGMYDQAQEIYQEGLEIARTIPDNRYYKRSFTGNLGILYAILGRLDEATPLIETSLRMGIEMNDPVAQGIDHQYLGSIQFARGNFREALKHYLEDARLMTEAGENHNIIRAYRYIAKVYDALNDFENAEIYYQKAVKVVDTKLQGKYRQFPQAYLRYAMHKIRRNDYEQADKLLEKAIAGYSSLNLPKELAACYLAQTRLEYHRGKFDRSLESASTAFGLYQQIAAGTADLAEAHLWLGLAHHALAQKDSALSHYNKAVALAPQSEDFDIAWRASFHLSQFHSENGDLVSSVKYAKQALDAIERQRRFTISFELASSFLTDKIQVYQHYFDDLFEVYRREPTEMHLQELFTLSEKTRGRVLLDQLNSGMQSIFSQLRQTTPLQDLEEQMVSMNLFIRKELTKPENEQRDEIINSWRKKLASLQREYELQSTQFATVHPEILTMLASGKIATPGQIRENLPRHTALISYFASEENLYAFVIDADRTNLKKLQINPKLLWEKITKLRRPFQDLKEGKIDFLRLTFDADLSHELYNGLLAPLSEAIAARNRLIIVPTGPLHYLPFELLVMNSNHRYLLEQYTISYLPAAALLPILNQKKSRSFSPQQSLFALGNPIFNPKQGEIELASISRPPVLRNMLLTPLPGAANEVREIAGLFDAEDVVALSETTATESAYKQQAGRFRFIHFATHGYANEQNPNFSALLLNPGDIKEDGFLYAYEIYPTRLNSELVSMSACETALGEYRAGEGLVSLVQAFFAAGSRSVLASLWTVEEAAYPLMVAFYRNVLAGMSKAEALQQAKLAFIRGEFNANRSGKISYQQPFLWAPFVLYGI